MLLGGQIGQPHQVVLKEVDGREPDFLLDGERRAVRRLHRIVQAQRFDLFAIAADVFGHLEQFHAALLGVAQLVRRFAFTVTTPSRSSLISIPIIQTSRILSNNSLTTSFKRAEEKPT